MGQLGLYIAEQTSADIILSLATRPVFTVLFDFRDLILRRSALGREFLALYTAHGEQALEVLKRHPPLLRRALATLLRAAVLAQDALRAHSYSSKEVAAGALKIDATMTTELRALIRDFAAVASKHDFSQMVTRYGAIIDQLDGLTTREILQLLAVDPLQKPALAS